MLKPLNRELSIKRVFVNEFVVDLFHIDPPFTREKMAAGIMEFTTFVSLLSEEAIGVLDYVEENFPKNGE